MAEEFDDLWAEARNRRMEPSAGLMARVLADALEVQPAPVEMSGAAARRGAGRGWLAGLADLFGGFGALAGVGGAALAGLVLGLVQPAPVTEMADAVLAGAVLAGPVGTVDLMPDVGGLWAKE